METGAEQYDAHIVHVQKDPSTRLLVNIALEDAAQVGGTRVHVQPFSSTEAASASLTRGGIAMCDMLITHEGRRNLRGSELLLQLVRQYSLERDPVFAMARTRILGLILTAGELGVSLDHATGELSTLVAAKRVAIAKTDGSLLPEAIAELTDTRRQSRAVIVHLPFDMDGLTLLLANALQAVKERR